MDIGWDLLRDPYVLGEYTTEPQLVPPEEEPPEQNRSKITHHVMDVGWNRFGDPGILSENTTEHDLISPEEKPPEKNNGLIYDCETIKLGTLNLNQNIKKKITLRFSHKVR